jgi:hypothetical protein
VLGIVLNVYVADNPNNRSSHVVQDSHGSQLEARVLVTNDGTDSPWIIPNVVILPRGASGVDDFHEEIPKGVTGTVDDSTLPSNFTEVPPHKLDGDWCVVDFIGGSINQPFMVSWWPHPSNRRDTTTQGTAKNALIQGRRLAKRFQGTRFVVTSKGTVLVDTSEANHKVKRSRRVVSPEGGDIRVTVKESKQLELNFNPSVRSDPDEDDNLWPAQAQKQTRATTSTKITITKDLVEAVAGEVIKLVAQRLDIVFSTPNGKQQLGVGADEPLVLGNRWKASMENLVDQVLRPLQVPTLFGPSGPAGAIMTPQLDSLKARFPDDISDFVFTRKDKA